MKNSIYIFSILLFFSCSNRSEKNSFNDDILVSDIEVEMESFEVAPESFKYKELSHQKLQEMYDLMSLKQSSPKFHEIIQLQLEAYTDEVEEISIDEDVKIENLELKEDIITVSDSIQKMKLYYDLVSNNTIKKDSIWMTIINKTIRLENELVTTKKVKFSSVKE